MTNRRSYLSLALAALSSAPTALPFAPRPPLAPPSRTAPPSSSSSTTGTTSLRAIGVLARKAKETEVRRYVESGPEPETLDRLREMRDAVSSGLPEPTGPGPLQRALTRRKGTVSVIAEYKRRLESSGYIDDVFDPVVLSPTFREAGAAAVAVCADERTGGCTYDDVSKFVEENDGAGGDVPGPCPVISSDLIVDEIQIARSAAYGASAAVVDAGVVGTGRVREFVDCGRALGMETIVGVSTAEEAQAAVDGGARILSVLGGADPKEKYAVVSSLIIPEGEEVCTINHVLAKDNKALEEVEEAWISRDLGFNSIWVCDALYKNAADPTERPGHIVSSMRAKSSVKWASPKAKSGKGEGAREYLGDILM